MLYDEIKDSVSAEGLQKALGLKSGREIFPDDERVKAKFGECNAYALKSSCKFILSEIERSFYGQHSEKYPDLETCTIEHFYPQTPTEEWRKLVGDEYELLENMHIDTFGNLSLSAQNSKLGNKDFEEKLTLINELDGDKLYLNEYFTNQDTWGIAEIEERSAYLAKKFCEVDIFKDLPKEYRVIELRKSLDDNLSFYKFTTLTLPNGETKNANDAKGLVKVTIDYLQENHGEAFNSFTMRYRPSCIVWNKEKAKLRENKPGWVCVSFGDFYFVSTASFQEVGKNLRELIEACGLNPQSFIVE